MITLDRETVALAGGEIRLAAEVAAFAAALTQHAETIDVPAPTACPLVESLVRQYGGEFEVEREPEAISEPTAEQLHQAAVAAVQAECRRRILVVMSEDRQRNTLAAGQAAMMQFGADPSGWPAELQQRQAQAMAEWAEIERLRKRSNEIEAMEAIPADLGYDGLWYSV